ncbi:hypothetical protein VN97_g7901 [Penicillium thymicola]|uniref:Uncharacterized protein n=1 Tax=Penicillium thymicola TaxID=293382 RepID=A0AAI9TDX0_PENTH|nr:hypothetical protein VN97_g7901 [Penicillium thymicola]
MITPESEWELYTNNGPHLLLLPYFSCGTITRLKYGISSAEIDPSRSRDTATKYLVNPDQWTYRVKWQVGHGQCSTSTCAKAPTPLLDKH